MTTIEISDYMDISTKPHGFILDDYEKSLLLTYCQEQMIEDLYSNNSSETFEETERRRRALGNLVYSYEAFRKEEDRPTIKYERATGEKDEDNKDIYEEYEYKTATGVNDNKVQSYSFGSNEVVEQKLTKRLNAFHKIKSDSVNVTLPENLMFIVYEQVVFDDDNLECLDGNTAVVIPITHDEYYRTMQNPFRRPNERRVFRLDVAHPRNEVESHNRILRLWEMYNERDNFDSPAYTKNQTIVGNKVINDINPYSLRDDDRPQLIELISKYRIGKYFCRYIKRPNPIITNELPDNLTIYGFNQRTESEVNPVLHKIIARNAVEMAVRNRSNN